MTTDSPGSASFEIRLRQLGIQIPALPPPMAVYVPAVRTGDLVFASGQTPTVDGVLQVQGKLGSEVSIEQGQQAARLAALNCVAEVRGLLGSLDRVSRIVRLTGFVASAPGFAQQPAVINGASQLIEEIFGEAGRHARSAIGVAELPGGAPVEIELIVEARGAA
ncbi:MAG: RidA family protein [Chloroflexota bacterium]|nr:MAG: RidA family protein [Chloroflexota bacterium]